MRNPARYSDPMGFFINDLAALFGHNAIIAEEVLAAAEGRAVDHAALAAAWTVMTADDVANLSAGLGDTLLPFAGKRLRNLIGGPDCIDYDSDAYSAGGVAGYIIWTAVFSAVTVETQVAARINLVKGENWTTNNGRNKHMMNIVSGTTNSEKR